jgi:drug/metabolite transporter (DMT)-like permease
MRWSGRHDYSLTVMAGHIPATTPAVSLMLANVFLDELFTPDLLAGSALIMAGVAFATWPARRTT